VYPCQSDFQADGQEWHRIFLLVNYVGSETEHDLVSSSVGHMMKIFALKEMHAVITKFLLLLFLIVIVDQVSCTESESKKE